MITKHPEMKKSPVNNVINTVNSTRLLNKTYRFQLFENLQIANAHDDFAHKAKSNGQSVRC